MRRDPNHVCADIGIIGVQAPVAPLGHHRRRNAADEVASFMIIYRDSRGLIRSRSQGTLVFVMAERCREDVMSDLKADWWRWDSGRKIVAASIAFGMTGLVPALLLLGGG